MSFSSPPYIAYYRVSTTRQESSGLGLEAQQRAVASFIAAQHGVMLKEFTEVASGKRGKRPVLQQALQECRKYRAILVIAKLDRLSRSMAFVSSLMESRVEFVAVDNPRASRLMLHMLAAFAEHEREQISIRTKEALRSAKARGVALGRTGHVRAGENRATALAFAHELLPLLTSLQEEGFTTVRAITEALNQRHIPTASGEGRWHVATVYRLLQRIRSG